MTIRRGGAAILADLTLDLPGRGVTGLVGPMGSGKSTLLAWLCGKTADMTVESGELRTATASCPVLIAQHSREEARSAAESTALALLRHIELQTAAPGDGLLCIDEPTAGLFAPEGARLMRALRRIGTRRPVLVVSHNIGELREVCTRIVVLAAGRIVSDSPAEAFFAAKAGPEAAHFLRTHGISVPHPEAIQSALAPEYRPRLRVVTDIVPPSGQGWIVPGALWLGDGAPGGVWYGRMGGDLCCRAAGSETCFGAGDACLPEIAHAIRARCAKDVVALAPEARLLGAVLLRIGIAPDQAAQAIARALPVPEGFEHWLWETDLAMSLADDRMTGERPCF